MILKKLKVVFEDYFDITNIITLTFLVLSWLLLFFGSTSFFISSDFSIHIPDSFTNEQSYTLVSYIIRLCYLGNINNKFGSYALSIVLVINNLIYIFALTYLARYISNNSKVLCMRFAILSCMCMAIYLPIMNRGLYGNTVFGNLFHNSTSLFSRTLVPIILVILLKLLFNENTNNKKKDSLFLMILLSITTAFKPSFIFVAIPALAIYFIYISIKFKFVYFRKCFGISLCFIPAFIIALIQYYMLYINVDKNNANHIVLYFPTYKEYIKIFMMYFRSLLLPLISLLFINFKFKNFKQCSFVFYFMLIAILESVYLIEDGTRRYHGNFAWGTVILYQSVFLVSIASLFNFDTSSKRNKRIYAIGVTTLYLHIVFGILYILLSLFYKNYYF